MIINIHNTYNIFRIVVIRLMIIMLFIFLLMILIQKIYIECIKIFSKITTNKDLLLMVLFIERLLK